MIALLWPLSLGAFALGLDAFVLAGLLPAIASDLHISQAAAGLGVATYTAAYATSAPLLAPVAARASTRRALLIALALFALGNVATAFASSLAVLLVSRALAGIGAGIYSPLAASSAAGMVPAAQRGRALSMVLIGLSGGSAFGVPLGLLVEHVWGWRATIDLIVVVSLIAAAGINLSGREFPLPPRITWRERLDAIRAPFAVYTLLVTLLVGVASLGLYTYIAELAAARGMGDATGHLIWTWGLGGMVGALLIGRALDKWLPPPRATWLVMALLAIGFALVGWAPLMGAGAGCFLWGLAGWASVAPQQHALVSHSPDHAVALIACNSSGVYFGSALGATAGAAMLGTHLSVTWLPVASLVTLAVAAALHGLKLRQRASAPAHV